MFRILVDLSDHFVCLFLRTLHLVYYRTQTRDQTDHVMGVDHVNDPKSNSSIKTNYLRRTWVLFLYRNLKWLRKTFNSSFFEGPLRFFVQKLVIQWYSQNNADLSHIFDVSDHQQQQVEDCQLLRDAFNVSSGPLELKLSASSFLIIRPLSLIVNGQKMTRDENKQNA